MVSCQFAVCHCPDLIWMTDEEIVSRSREGSLSEPDHSSVTKELPPKASIESSSQDIKQTKPNEKAKKETNGTPDNIRTINVENTPKIIPEQDNQITNDAGEERSKKDDIPDNGIDQVKTQKDIIVCNGIDPVETQKDNIACNGIEPVKKQNDNIACNDINPVKTQKDNIACNSIDKDKTMNEDTTTNGNDFAATLLGNIIMEADKISEEVQNLSPKGDLPTRNIFDILKITPEEDQPKNIMKAKDDIYNRCFSASDAMSMAAIIEAKIAKRSRKGSISIVKSTGILDNGK